MSKKNRLLALITIPLLLMIASRSGAMIRGDYGVKSLPSSKNNYTETFVSQANVQRDNYSGGDLPLFIFGYSADAPPVSLASGGGANEPSSDTLCGALYTEVRNIYGQSHKIIPKDLDSSERFRGFSFESDGEIAQANFAESDLGLECGPNSKTEDRKNILESFGGEFSKTFFYTGTKLLVHKNNRRYLYDSDFPFVDRSDSIFSDLPKKKIPDIRLIGVVGGSREALSNSGSCPDDIDASEEPIEIGTTTGENLPSIYGAPTKILALRSQAVNCLNDGKIIAYASDEILLTGMLKDNKENLSGYVIEPRTNPLTYEEYGVVIYGSDANGNRSLLKERIDNWLDVSSEEVFEKIFEEENYDNYHYASDDNPVAHLVWRHLESFYRKGIPLTFLKSGSLVVIFSAFFTLFTIVILLTHRWIATQIVRVFPFLFTIPISGIRKLRRRGIDKSNWLLLMVAESMRGLEETLVETLHKSGGRRASKVDEYDVLQLLQVQLRISERINYLERKQGLDASDANESVAEGVAEQMKYNPHARKVFEEAVQSGAQSFGGGIGTESANQILRLLSRVSELINTGKG